jgi:hypothetical protein
LVQKSISSRASKQASILHTPPNPPSQPPFFRPSISPSKRGSHIYFLSLSSLLPNTYSPLFPHTVLRGVVPAGGAPGRLVATMVRPRVVLVLVDGLVESRKNGESRDGVDGRMEIG